MQIWDINSSLPSSWMTSENCWSVRVFVVVANSLWTLPLVWYCVDWKSKTELRLPKHLKRTPTSSKEKSGFTSMMACIGNIIKN